MDLAAFFDQSCCSVSLKARSKNDVLDALAALAAKSSRAQGIDQQSIAAILKEREEQGSTGFGDEIAIPHARIPGMESFLLFAAHAPRGAEFDSLDKKKVKLFFVILGPEDRPSEHVQILAALSRALSGTSMKKELMAAASNDVLAESFLRHTQEKQEQPPAESRKMKLLILILYMDEFLYHILEYFLEQGVEGATILESSGMGQYISNIPLFATFIGFMNQQKNRSNTILATIPAEKEDDIVKGIQSITGDLNQKQGAMLMTLDISFWKGTMKMM